MKKRVANGIASKTGFLCALILVAFTAHGVVTVEVGTTYKDPGASASDNYDGDISARIVTTNTVNTAMLGTYTVTYSVSDSSGNPATPVVRTVQVVDRTKPVITLVGNGSVTVDIGSAYADAGATALDNYDGNITTRITATSTVNTAVPGSYTVTYNVSDSSGNAATPVVRTVQVAADQTKPVITLVGNATLNVELGATYKDAGATAQDNHDGDITARIVATNTVNTAVAGTYTVTYNVSDAAGNAASPVVRTVQVADRTKPVITLVGSATVSVDLGAAYKDAGATALDSHDGDLTARIVTGNPVNTAIAATYIVTYNVSDAAGNAAAPVSRTVRVSADQTKPVITLAGNATVTVGLGSEYADAGATALDNHDGNITAHIVTTSTVNAAVPGTYTVTYNVSDAAGNAADPVVRTVNVADQSKPVITLVGNATVAVQLGSKYTDAGATAQDNRDGDITDRIVATNAVNTAVAGAYTVAYNVSDAAGNAADPVVRTVNVAELTKPIITLVGQASVTVQVGTAYQDAGATALDAYEGSLTARIQASSNVNTAQAGVYTVTYNVSDSFGNAAAPVVRTVTVVNSAGKPVITLLGNATVIIQKGAAYADAGATARAGNGTDLTARIVTTNNVNTAVAGTYKVTYNVSDAFGSAADPAVRTVMVVASPKPVITLLGSATVTIQAGAAYADAGATARDSDGTDLTSRIVTTSNVNTSVPGAYTVTYNVSNLTGTAADPVIRNVTVTSLPKPVITLIGSASVKTKFGRPYVDLGATAVDGAGKDITSRIVATNNVNVWWPGTYKVTYNVSDAAGQAATPVVRVVRVTFLIKTEQDGSELLIASPLGGSTYYVNTAEGRAPLTFTASAPTNTESVTYALDGVPIGSADQPPYAVSVDLDLAATLPGEHLVDATAQVGGTHVSAQSTFTLAALPPATDVNTNGLPDNPFATLAVEGDTWLNSVSAGNASAKRMVAVTRFEGSGEDQSLDVPVALVLADDQDAARNAQVSVPRALLDENETGVVIFEIANDLATLVGDSEAAQVEPEPDKQVLVKGGQYVEISVLVSADGGATFDELDPARLAAHPVHIDFAGLEPTPGLASKLYTHPMFVDSDPVTGVMVTAESGDWSTSNAANLVAEEDTLAADLTALSLVAPYESASDDKGTPAAGRTGCAGGSMNTGAWSVDGDLALIGLVAMALLTAGTRKAKVRVKVTHKV